MDITTQTGLVGFLLALSTLSVPAANAMSQPTADATPTIEGRLTRITAAIRQRETLLPDSAQLRTDLLVAIGFADGGRGNWNQYVRGGTATGARGNTFNNVHPAYGGAGWRDSGGFMNGAYRGFANGTSGSAGFVNGAYRGGGFVNGGGGGFYNRY